MALTAIIVTPRISIGDDAQERGREGEKERESIAPAAMADSVMPGEDVDDGLPKIDVGVVEKYPRKDEDSRNNAEFK